MRLLYLHLFDLDFAGGSGVYLRALVTALTALGHTVDVVSARRPDQYGCTTHRLPFDFTLTFGPEKRDGERALGELDAAELHDLAGRAVDALAVEAFARGPFDLVLVNHLSLMAEVARRLKARFGVPYRIISYGTDTDLMVRDPRHLEHFEAAAAGADRIFAISHFVAKQVTALMPGLEVETLGGAVDDALFHPPAAEPPAGRRIAYVGRLVTEKGLWTLLEALGKQTIPTELDVVGEGPLRGALERHLAASPLCGRVRLRGYTPPDRLRAVLLDTALLVVPSTWQEPLGLVVLEAMACGLPVVASAVGGIPEMIDHGANGYLVEPGDATALAATLDRVLGDPAVYRALRAAVRRQRVPTYRELARRVIA